MDSVLIPGMPGLQSFAWGTDSQGRWILIGGRTDGLHRRQPWATFDPADNNDSVWVIDIGGRQVWGAPVSSLPYPVSEQFTASNMQFYQEDNDLWITGGYGYSPTADDHITYPVLTHVDLDAMSSSVRSGSSLAGAVTALQDSLMAVTGGGMIKMDTLFYLIGGQYFEGRYNPMGPTHGPGFIQRYTNSIRVFTADFTGGTIHLHHHTSWNDSASLHRRDYNLVPQRFADGTYGATAFTGVFQYTADIPWLNIVDISDTGYFVPGYFSQMLSQYHSAKMPLYDPETRMMHTVFFGGMSQHYYDALNRLVTDLNVPFVRTISCVSRDSTGLLSETLLPIQMPGLTGSASEFIPGGYLPDDHGILRIDTLSGKVLAGYLVGGIRSTAPNIFWINTGIESDAIPTVYSVWLERTWTGLQEDLTSAPNQLSGMVFPNPVLDGRYTIRVTTPYRGNCILSWYDDRGNLVKEVRKGRVMPGTSEWKWNVPDKMPAGLYFLRIQVGASSTTLRVIMN